MSLLLSGIDPKPSLEMDERRKQLMFQDILYNFSFLTTAVNLQDENIFPTTPCSSLSSCATS